MRTKLYIYLKERTFANNILGVSKVTTHLDNEREIARGEALCLAQQLHISLQTSVRGTVVEQL